MKRPFMLWPLIFFLLLLSLGGGFYGGIALLLDPTGSSLDLDEVLHLLPVPNYILPGLFLLIVMGVLPLLLAIALIFRPQWSKINTWFQWSKHYWAWTGTLILVAILAVWLTVEGVLIGVFPIIYITAVIGLLILLFAMIPSVRNYYVN